MVIESITCDSCGKDIWIGKAVPDIIEGVKMDLSFGYGSNRDNESYEICLCDDCFDKMVDVMKIDLKSVDVNLM